MKNTSDRLISRMTMAKEIIKELENILIKFSKLKSRKNKKTSKPTKDNIQKLWGNLRRYHIYIHNENTRNRKEREFIKMNM